MTAVNGAVVWSAKYSSFGKAEVDPGSTVENNFRFAGQYKDSETGMHYNYHRYYDPQVGRYLRTDPLNFGSSEKPNLYLYVDANPIRFKDNLGLFKVCTPWFDIKGEEKVEWSNKEDAEWVEKINGINNIAPGPFGPTAQCTWEKWEKSLVSIKLTPTRWCFDSKSCNSSKIQKEEGKPHYDYDRREKLLATTHTPAMWLGAGDGVIYNLRCDKNYRYPLLPYPDDF